MILTKMT